MKYNPSVDDCTHLDDQMAAGNLNRAKYDFP